MDRFRWCLTTAESELADGESSVATLSGVTLYNGPGRTNFDKGRLTLTSHRLLWQQDNSTMSLPLAAVISSTLQHASGSVVATPKIMLKLLSPTQLLNAVKAMPTRPPWSAAWIVDSGNSRVAMAAGLDYIRLGFTQGGHNALHAALNETLAAKVWTVALKPGSGHVGVAGIERSMLAQTVSVDRSIATAFTDLSKLMENAKEMVVLSKNLSQRIRTTKASGEKVAENDMTELRMAMLSMGLEDVNVAEEKGTADIATYSSSFHRQLASQICRLLQPLLEQRTAGVCGGCIDLTTAYCRVNRARGVQLIAPNDLLEAARLMPVLELPLRLKTFPSGLKVLQLASESEEATLKATCDLLPSDGSKGLSAGELARKAGIAPVLARERLLLCEQEGMLCRDDTEWGIGGAFAYALEMSLAEDCHEIHHENHDHHSFEITRGDLFKPYKPSRLEKYLFPFIANIIDKPVTLFREQIVERIRRKKFYYYHQRYARVPEIDSCRVGDRVCITEANDQFHRDRLVDANIVRILRQRVNECKKWYDRDYEDMDRFCKPYVKDHEEAATNFFIKYGELYYWSDVRDAFMKQKHRMLWEREHGPIGPKSGPDSGDKEADNAVSFLRRFHAHPPLILSITICIWHHLESLTESGSLLLYRFSEFINSHDNMDPRIALPKPHRGSRQAHRRSRRRYMPRANGQFNPVRYVPPAELRQPTYAKNEGLKAPALYSRRSDEPIWQSRQNEEHGFSYAKDSQNFHKPAPLSVSNHPVSTFANAEQICVSLDYVPDRGRMLWSRWVLILICLTQLLSAFAVIGCHAVDFSEDTKLEVGVSLGILAFGNIFSTGVVTSVLFYRRWRSAETQTRSKTGEANHEAWICTRAALSLIGMAPIARYVELLGIYRRLSRLERSHAKEVKSPPKNSQFQYRDSLPRNPQEPADVDETARELENVHRLRRLFVEFDFDACVVALANASLGAGPFAIAQGVLYLRRLMLSRMMPNSTSGAILASFIFSILWLTSAACQFQPDAHYLSCAELLRLPAHRHQHLVSASGRILLFFARGFHITIRMITFTLFTGLFYWLLAVVVAVHQVLYLLLLLVYRGSKGILSSAYKASPNYRRPLDQRLKTKGILRHLGTDLLYTYVSIFDFFNGSAGKTRLRVIIYYFTYYLENSAMIGAWYAAYPFTASWYHLPALLVVVTVQWIGAIFLQLYFFYFSPSPRGTSLCGLCCPDELRGPVELVYSPAPFTYPPVQNAHHLPPPPIDNLSFILQPTSLYSRRGQLGPEPGHGEPSRTDSLTVVTAEMPRKPRSRYLYVKDPVEDESMEAWNEWEGVEGIIPPEDEDV
ncbi:NADH ubiquinone oxidoreductase subunit 10 [Echinococcus multilocularis]|uniref:XK-related protein n=1 Tax=Echinococcus multilocularis TaxID=6211 RepID=A0A087VYK4_ECHMU|nr:NADH ubiquinone oxidoreductase subunit 10 [Echinococcus multilocularis]